MSTEPRWTEAEFHLQYEDTRKHFEQYATQAQHYSPALFDFVRHIMSTLKNDEHGVFMLGYIRGMVLRDIAEGVAVEHDEEAHAFYVRLRRDDVAQTQEVVANIDWRSDGQMIGIELLPGASPTPPDPALKAITEQVKSLRLPKENRDG
jgi:hypothetical protein